MKLALTSAAAVATALIAAIPASASTILLNGGTSIFPPSSFAPTQCFQNSPGAGGATCDLNDTVAVGGTYQSLYEFQLGGTFTLTGSIFTNTLSGITFQSVTLYSNGPVNTGTYGTTGTATSFVLTGGSTSMASLPDTVLGAGRYTVAVNAKVNSTSTTVSSNFSFAAPAPEPATWAMMLVGFGVVGGALRTSRRKVVFA